MEGFSNIIQWENVFARPSRVVSLTGTVLQARDRRHYPTDRDRGEEELWSAQ